jgi:hypothetical protein
MQQIGNAIYIHPVSGELDCTWLRYGLDLQCSGYIFLEDFEKIYNCKVDVSDFLKNNPKPEVVEHVNGHI